MKCPECSVDLLMGERLTVQIDYCPKCRGIWLEKGKLDQLLGSSQGCNVNNQNKYDRKNDRRRDDDDDERGVGGFIRGIFD
jgi:uncharacterized protein